MSSEQLAGIESETSTTMASKEVATAVKAAAISDALTFEQRIEEMKKKILAKEKMALTTTDESCHTPLEHAAVHAACLKVLGEKLREAQTVYIYPFFNNDIQAAVVYINNKPVLSADDSLCVWRATKAIMNRAEIADSVACTLGIILTAIGYEVFLKDSAEPFTAILKGREDLK